MSTNVKPYISPDRTVTSHDRIYKDSRALHNKQVHNKLKRFHTKDKHTNKVTDTDFRLTSYLLKFNSFCCSSRTLSTSHWARAKTSGSVGSFHSHPYLPVESGERMGAVPLASWRGLLPAPAKGLKGWSRAATDGSLGAAARTLGAKPT